MRRRVAVFGGSFNPPGVHHRAIVEAAAELFDEVVVVPCGPRPDKATTNFIDPIHRAVMCDMTFAGIPNVTVDLSDLELDVFTRTHHLEARYRQRGEVWHIIGADQIEGGARRASFIHRRWMHADEMWRTLNFAVFSRAGRTINPADMPPQSMLIDIAAHGASCIIRNRIAEGESCEGLVVPRVREYIARHHLYRGTRPPATTPFSIEECKPHIVFDERNEKARSLAHDIRHMFGDHEIEHANIIFVVGGDGTMLHAVREKWRARLPFFGINAGHRGFLLNAIPDGANAMAPEGLIIRTAPLLYVVVWQENGEVPNTLAFNDAWVERASGQTAWIKIEVDGTTLTENLIGDGVLIATPAGSTAYARVMGAAPLHVGVEALVLAGSNVVAPQSWAHAIMEMDSFFTFTPVDPVKRPIRAYIDGVDYGVVRAMSARVSRIASVEMVFTKDQDIAEKFARMLRM